jgi:glutamate synthase domain-containing protein 2
LAAAATALLSLGWLVALVPLVVLLLLGIRDVIQRRHAILRNYPVIGHARYLLESLRPEMQQYFIEQDQEGTPYDRQIRTIIYERAKGIAGVNAFGTEQNVNAVGHEFLLHSVHPAPQLDDPPRVHVGGPDCTKPYDMALLNVSAMSFGALSANAVLALNWGAAKGGFAQDTGEGGLSKYHLEHGGDLVWELGSGYFGARTKDGGFDADMFADKAAHDSVKMVELKLSQGAKPGIGGVLPGSKVSAEIAEARSVPQGQTCISPPSHKVFSTPRELIQFIARMRRRGGLHRPQRPQHGHQPDPATGARRGRRQDQPQLGPIRARRPR